MRVDQYYKGNLVVLGRTGWLQEGQPNSLVGTLDGCEGPAE